MITREGPVIQVLPAPTLDNVIRYSQNFNIGINGSAYDKDNFDYLVSPSAYCRPQGRCEWIQVVELLNIIPCQSAKKYRFSINTYLMQKGYPFTEVEYVQDNTGRSQQSKRSWTFFRT
jgi:hypothetical protein